MMDEVLRIVYGDEYDIALKRARSDGIEQGIAQGMEQGMERGMERGMRKGMERGMEKGMEKGMEQGRMETRKEYERILTQKDRELEATARELRELKSRYGLP